METVAPLSPFDDWPRQLCDHDLGTFAWFAEPAVFVTQTLQPRASLAHARFAASAMDHVLATQGDQVQAQGGLLVLHDWRTVSTFDSDARAFYTARVESYQSGIQRAAYIAVDRNPLVRAILQLGSISLPFRTGHPVQFVDNPTPVLAKHAIRPRPGNPFADMAYGAWNAAQG